MNLLVWNLPQRCAARDVRRFLEHELGEYASDIEVHDAGTAHAYATATLATDVPYIGEAIAQKLCHQRLLDEPLRARASASGDASIRLH
ncbi:RNA-binding protein [Caballeronia sp. J97]|uniref:RNA-binding protein n=1 Tax=Caballeronia sp. J97 TaxID=2805429 RepID=UPI002AB30EFD|nr:RNA-binding protein [Caballeronia sp. J97]